MVFSVCSIDTSSYRSTVINSTRFLFSSTCWSRLASSASSAAGCYRSQATFYASLAMSFFRYYIVVRNRVICSSRYTFSSFYNLVSKIMAMLFCAVLCVSSCEILRSKYFSVFPKSIFSSPLSFSSSSS